MKALLISILVVLIVLQSQAKPSNFVRNSIRGNVKLESDAEPLHKVTWKDLVDSFFEGTEIDDFFDNSTECVHDFENSYEDVYEAITHFIQRGWTWENWLDFNEAIGTFTPLVRTCYDPTHDSIEDAQNFFASFDSFIDFAMQARDNCVVHVLDWYQVYANINDAFQKGKTKDVAYEIGHALNLFFVFDPRSPRVATKSNTVTALPDLHWLEEFLQGFINGTQVLSSDSVEKCVNETLFMVDSLTDANEQFKKKGEEFFKQGVFELADMCEHCKPLNEQCYKGTNKIIATFKKYIKTFKNPIDILFNMAKHFNELYVDGIELIQHFNKEEWYDAGFSFGDIFFNVFFDA